VNLEALIVRMWTSTWRWPMDGAAGTDSVTQLVYSQPWECDKVCLPMRSHGELADGGPSYREVGRNLKLRSAVNL